ncbi:polypeptide deformylase [Microcystis phage Mel-JY01]
MKTVFPILLFNKSVKNKLNFPTTPVNIDDETERIVAKKILRYLNNTMELADGCGIAANQVGISKSICIIRRDDYTTLEMINPKIVVRSDGMSNSLEGCLSIPNISAMVPRINTITVSYIDSETWKETSVELFGSRPGVGRATYESYVAQHEIDHLNGILFIDRVEKERRSMMLESNRYKATMRGKIEIKYFAKIIESKKSRIMVPAKYVNKAHIIYDDDITETGLISIQDD